LTVLAHGSQRVMVGVDGDDDCEKRDQQCHPEGGDAPAVSTTSRIPPVHDLLRSRHADLQFTRP